MIFMANVGIKYRENRRRLIRMINRNDEILEVNRDFALGNRCYLCQSKIADGSEMRRLEEQGNIRGIEITTKYTIHEKCYQSILCKG